MIKKIDGLYYKYSEDGNKKMSKGYASKQECAGMSENVLFEMQDFTFEVSESSGSKFATIKGTALTTGVSKNKRNYSYKNLQENDGKSFNVIVGHRVDYDNPKHNVGDGVYKLGESNKLLYEAKIRNTLEYPDIVEKVADGLVAPSVQGGFKNIKMSSELNESGEKVFDIEGLKIPLLALVNKHTRGVDGATIEAVLAESELMEADEVNTEIMEAKKMADETEQLKSQLKEAQDKLALVLKEAEDMKKMDEKMKKEEEMKKKKAMSESLIGMNKDLKESELMEKSLSELSIMESYEKQIESSKKQSEGAGEVVEKEEQELLDKEGIIVEKDKDLIGMSKETYKKFNKELMESVYR